MDAITTHGMTMPKLGLGTWRLRGDECRDAVLQALDLGYRHIDTAEMYGNEDAIGEAVTRSPVSRADIHVTTKVWWDHLAPAAMAEAIDHSLARLQTEYVDLYLIHWPAPGMDMEQAMDSLLRIKESGKARAIGVANFTSALMAEALATGAPIACNQVEYHALLSQERLLAAMRPDKVALMAYAPLAQGRLGDWVPLREIAAKHGATPAQIVLKWLLDQPGVGAIPKAAGRDRQQANLDALQLVLDDEDRAVIAALPKDQRFVKPDFAPAWDTPD